MILYLGLFSHAKQFEQLVSPINNSSSDVVITDHFLASSKGIIGMKEKLPVRVSEDMKI